ncbi:MAG TPA: MarR family transcriptional regulator [Reyranella sp.]|jgi:hypothetical protein|nr:MarR family transcriptional regulator [Reyranella sp.]
MEAGAGAADSIDDRFDRRSALLRLKEFRRRIDRHFPPGLCRDRNLEMLLGLYEAHLARSSMTTRSLADLTDLDQGAALRRLNLLEQKGLIERQLDLADRRRTTISLSERGRASVESFIDSYADD